MNSHELAEHLLQYPDMEVRIGGRQLTAELRDFPTIVGVPKTPYFTAQHIWVWEGIPEEEKADYRPAMEFYIE